MKHLIIESALMSTILVLLGMRYELLYLEDAAEVLTGIAVIAIIIASLMAAVNEGIKNAR